MDDIYNDLENFNDVNIVEELKNENKELKFKLEEYSSAMQKLQKNILQDFDKLSVEYKNLEKNYSSLLKTARAEIERKTDTIKKLNLEKDTLVLNSLQKGKNILHNRRSNFKDTQIKKPNEDIKSCLNEVKNTIKGSTERSDNQLQVNTQPSVETVSSIPNDCQSTYSENKISKMGLDNKIPKEGCVTGRDERDKAYTKDNLQERPSVMKVMNRRKSIPSFGDCEPTFSSDEDSRKTNLEPQQRQPPLSGEDVRHFERHYVTQDYVLPDTFDNYQAPPSSYQKRGNRYNDFERQRNYESSDQSRRYFSPDNQHHRYGKDFPENYNQRDHRDKRRVDRSPPSDRYNLSKSRDRRHNFERENYRDTGRYSYHNNDHLPAKSKSKFELEEPSRKRPKIDTYSRHAIDQNFNKEKERGLPEKYSFTKPKEPLEPFLNQSPDFIVNSNVLHHSVKETRPTATIPLPELTNIKCILKTDNQTSTLATGVGGSVDKITICQSTRVEDKQKSLDKSNPKAVDLMSEINVDIENIEKSNSLESGEIRSLDEDVSNVTNESNIVGQTKENVKSSDYKSNQIPPHLSATIEVGKTLTNKYKIPLLRKKVTKESSNTQQHLPKKLQTLAKDFKVIVEGKHLSEKCPDKNINNIGNANPIHTKKPESVLQKLMNEKKCSENDNRKKLRSSDKVVNISTIAGDLELSDETSDNIDLVKEDISPDVKIKKTEQLPKKEKHTSSEKVKDRANKSDDKGKKSKDIKKSSNNKKENVKEKTRDSSSSKKRKSKKQIDDEKVSIFKEEISPQTTKGKEKDNKQTSLDQRKNKFSDLFGDSNSLITPDDLGLSNVTPDKYVSVDDNTQDAIDLSVEDITMVKARKSSDNTHVEEKFLQQIPDDTAANATATNCENRNIIGNENCESNRSTTLMYENAISETNSSSIVKTVIISTGVQPQHNLKNVNDVSSPNINEDKNLKKNALNNIKAIALPTPNKLINSKESQTNMESIQTSNNVDKPDISTDADNNLKTNTSENNCESDIPDVRIFVRRRKKVMKKTTK